MTYSEELAYIGPTSIQSASEEELTKGQIQDEQDLGTLEKVQKLLRNRQKYYQSVDALSLGELTVENQLIINQKVLFHLQETEELIDQAITETKERLNG